MTGEAKQNAESAPHSRACGPHPHAHGGDCHANCPTCGGSPLTSVAGWLDPRNPRHSCYDEMPSPLTREDWQRRWRCSCGRVYRVLDSQLDGYYLAEVRPADSGGSDS